MRAAGLIATVVLFACGLVGCETKPKVSNEVLTARINAAKLVSDGQQRDLALRAVALDAAKAQRTEHTRRAITDMTDNRLRDQTASQAARILHEGKMFVQATEIANMISDQQLKDQTLLQMAGYSTQNK